MRCVCLRVGGFGGPNRCTNSGNKVLAYGDVYGGTFRLLKQVFEKYGVTPVFTDDTSPAAFANLIDGKTKLLWLESPTNALLGYFGFAAGR